ncbi:MAG: hypothetical protein R3302_05240 [Sulfurimonadaceae bacterium]|nr:hypothetical protein [Sulfurimonadaceae bacterium]
MVITARTSFEASVQLLRVVWAVDYRSVSHRRGIIAVEYVYFDPVNCRFYFSDVQHADAKYLLKRYMNVDPSDAIRIAASKHSFCRILLGAVAYRKMFTYREFFEIVRTRPEWFV